LYLPIELQVKMIYVLGYFACSTPKQPLTTGQGGTGVSKSAPSNSSNQDNVRYRWERTIDSQAETWSWVWGFGGPKIISLGVAKPDFENDYF